ncbi:unnamed protein product [Cuscuta epithymum]|uniref:Protein kinase domain-containing protein n=1 Tax=Cuscuta epithymum TaxID=186058 RepID=A0AAV0EFE4_9ASTE|nr:unnamed protein product [Cuscuta epithymum]
MAQAVSYAAALILACFTSFVSPDAQGVALSALKASLNASSSELTDWYESEVNPCTWSKITCDATNNVIMVSLPNMGFSGTLSPSIGVLKKLNALLLKGNGITGSIPEEIGNLSSLTTLDLQNNKLSGAIPTSLANLKKLQFLYLNQNNLTGKIPESLSSLPSLINLQLDTNGLTGQIPAQLFQVPKFNFTGNYLNCGFNFSRHCETSRVSSSKSKTTGMVIGIAVGILGVMVLVGSLLLLFFRGRHRGYMRELFVDVAGEVDRQMEFGQLKRFTWTELQKATNNFSEKNVVGEGGFGIVYKGVFSDNTKIAVKRLTNNKIPHGDVSFYREVEMISVAVHRNLLRLIGFCTTPTQRLLVYPFMPNLSVAYRLRGILFIHIY